MSLATLGFSAMQTFIVVKVGKCRIFLGVAGNTSIGKYYHKTHKKYPLPWYSFNSYRKGTGNIVIGHSISGT